MGSVSAGTTEGHHDQEVPMTQPEHKEYAYTESSLAAVLLPLVEELLKGPYRLLPESPPGLQRAVASPDDATVTVSETGPEPARPTAAATANQSVARQHTTSRLGTGRPAPSELAGPSAAGQPSPGSPDIDHQTPGRAVDEQVSSPGGEKPTNQVQRVLPTPVRAGLWLLPQVVTFTPHLNNDRAIRQSVAKTIADAIARSWTEVQADPRLLRDTAQHLRYRLHLNRRCIGETMQACVEETREAVLHRYPHLKDAVEPVAHVLESLRVHGKTPTADQELLLDAALHRLLRLWEHEARITTTRAQIIGVRRAVVELADELNTIVPGFAQAWRVVESTLGRPPEDWDVSGMGWRLIDLDALRNIHQQLLKDKHIQRLSRLVARGFDSEPQRAESVSVHFQPATIRESLGVSEVIGQDRTNKPVDLTPVELAMLLDPDTEWFQTARLARSDATRYTYRRTGRMSVRRRKPSDKTSGRSTPSSGIQTEAGPVFVCLDTSGSMKGLPETVAGTLALGIARAAPAHHREAYLIAFGERLETIDLTDPTAGLPRFTAFLGTPAGKGTDTAPPLEQTLRILEKQRRLNADVVIVSDFRFPMIMSGHLDRMYKLQKRLQTRFHALTIHRDPVEDPLNVFDYRWHYNTGERGTAGINPEAFRGL